MNHPASKSRVHNWKLSPSDFAFLWEECRRCFYLKVVSDFKRPSTPMPKIFTTIDQLMKQRFAGQRTDAIIAGLPGGVFEYSEHWVESRPVAIPGQAPTCFIRGKFDTVVRFDDGGFGVVDFKTSARNSEHIPLYARQLHAYACALEQAAPGRLALSPVRQLGLLVYEPKAFEHQTAGACSLSGSLSWIEIPRDNGGFMDFLGEVLEVLDQPAPPAGSASCPWCAHRDTARRTGL
jgi:hypothetical protein